MLKNSDLRVYSTNNKILNINLVYYASTYIIYKEAEK